jgi:hypothetical protein
MDFLLRLAVVYLFGCAFLTLCFGAEWALTWWDRRKDDNPFDIGEYSALDEAEWKARR